MDGDATEGETMRISAFLRRLSIFSLTTLATAGCLGETIASQTNSESTINSSISQDMLSGLHPIHQSYYGTELSWNIDDQEGPVSAVLVPGTIYNFHGKPTFFVESARTKKVPGDSITVDYVITAVDINVRKSQDTGRFIFVIPETTSSKSYEVVLTITGFRLEKELFRNSPHPDRVHLLTDLRTLK